MSYDKSVAASAAQSQLVRVSPTASVRIAVRSVGNIHLQVAFVYDGSGQFSPLLHLTKQKMKRLAKEHLEEIWRKMWTSGFRFSWRKIEMAAQHRAGWKQEVYGLCSTASSSFCMCVKSHS